MWHACARGSHVVARTAPVLTFDLLGAANALDMDTKYTAVAFDFFGVLCSHVAPRWLAEHCSPGRANEVRELILNKVDRGEISQQEMFEQLAALTGSEAGHVEGQWHALAAIDDEMIALLRELRGSVRLALLSNASWPFLRSLLRQADIETLFDCIIISSECGHAKPDDAIYKRLLDTLNEPARSVVFVDDTAENVIGARRAGMFGVHFQTPRDLREVLVHMALL